jgi:hypothetical protein
MTNFNIKNEKKNSTLDEKTLEEKRQKLDELRAELALLKKKEGYWLKCPKCGGQMEEENLVGILIDRCVSCNGLYFDSGELETLLDVEDRTGFFASIRRKFYN